MKRGKKEKKKKSFMHFHNKHIENTNTFHPFPSPLKKRPCNKPALSHTDRMTHAKSQNVWEKKREKKQTPTAAKFSMKKRWCITEISTAYKTSGDQVGIFNN